MSMSGDTRESHGVTTKLRINHFELIILHNIHAQVLSIITFAKMVSQQDLFCVISTKEKPVQWYNKYVKINGS